jgi:hypothetical protein
LLAAFDEEDIELVGRQLERNPNDVRLRALYTYRVLRKYDLHMLTTSESEDPDIRESIARKIKEAKRLIPEVIQIAALGEKQEPDNAFFPIAQAIAYEKLDDRSLAIEAASRAARCKYYNDYSFEMSTLYEAQQPRSPYVQFYGRIEGGSAFLWEIRKLGRRWSNSNDPNVMQMRKYILDLCPLLAKSASTSHDVGTVIQCVRYSAIRTEELSGQREFGRRSNDGDLYRTLTNRQNEMIAAGQRPRIDFLRFMESKEESI